MNKRDMKMDESLAEKCYVNPSEFDYKKYAALIRADEREECAKVCDGLADMHEKMNQWGQFKTAETLAQAIRARSKA